MSQKNGKVDPNSVLVQYGPDALRLCVTEAMKEFDQRGDQDFDNRLNQETENAGATDGAASVDSSGVAGEFIPSGALASSTELPGESDESINIETRGDRLVFRFADRSYEVDGLAKNRSPGSLSVTIHGVFDKDLFADRIEIYSAKDRERFIRSCSAHSGLSSEVIRLDLMRMHGNLRERQDLLLREAEKPKPGRVVPSMSESEKEAALNLLKSPGLTATITEHFAQSGYVGEEINLLSGYIAATSRLLAKPLHVLYRSSTAAGKTTLMKAVVAMMPPEAVFGYSSISPKALQYMQDRDLRHSIFLLEEDRRLDEAAREMIKLLKSEGRAANAVTIKDPDTGMMRAVDFVVDGPMNFQMTTTALVMDEEQSNRDFVASADESEEQTERILAMQRLLCTLEGKKILARREELRRLHRNAQRLLRPLSVINPYANHLTFPKHAHRLRRDHEKYIGLIEAVTLLHQYQREIKTRKLEDGSEEQYIETTLEDIKTANRIAAALLGQSLDDCPPHTRMFLDSVTAIVDREAKRLEIERDMVRLTASELARYTGLSVQMVRRHMSRLMDLELVYSDSGETEQRGEKRNSPFRRYAFVHRVTESHFLAGLLDTDELARRGSGWQR